MAEVCLELSGVLEPTEAALWVSVFSQEHDSAIGKLCGDATCA